jgi:hypothetical protein
VPIHSTWDVKENLLGRAYLRDGNKKLVGCACLKVLSALALIGSALSLGPGVYFLSVNASGFLASLFQIKNKKIKNNE